jgi:ABC-2 type transport system permease protein
MFLVILAGVFGHHSTRIAGGKVPTSVVYVPGIMTLGIIAASFINLVIAVTAQRESGVLKRRRATPVPATAIIAGRALTSVFVAMAIVVVLLGVGWVAYGVHIPGRTLLALAVTVIVGAVSFCCLGYALTTVIHDQESAQPVTQAIMLPLYFISGVFISTSSFPRWLGDVAGVFPVRHLVSALLSVYNPYTVGAGFDGKDLWIVVAWGLGGLLIAVRRFQWMSLAH